MINIKDIKIVVWDLDDTFWKGTLSEGVIEPIEQNVNLILKLTDCGIVNSICSKNDLEPTLEALSKISYGLQDLFVFPSVNWEPKGKRISEMLKSMGLRAENCLFIDDNVHNLEDARFHNPGIMTAHPDILPILIKESNNAEPTDKTHKRLKQYKILEAKNKVAKGFADNTEFLYSSNIQVTISRDCESQLDRIVELVQRSNQLNFTKRRDSKDLLKRLIDDPECDTGCVTVKDNFGDYGMVGFFAVKDNRCIHLLFSCRTIGQGVEEYVYSYLGYPELDTIEPVINHLSEVPAPGWINQTNDTCVYNNKSNAKIVIKGACDLMQMCEYLDSDSIIEEFTYVGKERNNYIEHHNHSVNYLNWRLLSKNERMIMIDKLVFNDKDMFITSLYETNVSLIILSTMIEPHMGIYRNKTTGFRIAFGDAKHPLTNHNEWADFKSGKLPQGSKFMTDEWLKWFSDNYEFLGSLTPDEILDNAQRLLTIIPKETKICYLLGPEINKENETDPTYIGREKVYAQVNKRFRLLSESNPRVLILDPNKWICKPSDLTNNLNHWNRRVYYELAKEANAFIKEISGQNVKKQHGIKTLLTHIIKDNISSTGFFQTKFWHWISSI